MYKLHECKKGETSDKKYENYALSFLRYIKNDTTSRSIVEWDFANLLLKLTTFLKKKKSNVI